MSALQGKASALPPTAELVDMLDAGASYDDLAALHGVTVKHLRGRDDDTADVIDLFAAFTAQDVAWMEAGLCAQTDPESFFPEKGGSTREGKATCAACPVAAECLDYALTNNERHGIWGGLSPRERRKVAKAMAPEAPLPANGNTDKTHCVNGHEFTPDNTYERPTGGRQCRKCQRTNVRDYKEKNAS